MTRTAAKKPANLERLAEQIHREHKATEAAFTNGLRHARKVGELLSRAKAQLEHGEWGRWVDAHCPFSWRTADAYLRIFERWEQLQSNSQQIANLTMNGALKLLSQIPKTKKEKPDTTDTTTTGGECERWEKPEGGDHAVTDTTDTSKGSDTTPVAELAEPNQQNTTPDASIPPPPGVVLIPIIRAKMKKQKISLRKISAERMLHFLQSCGFDLRVLVTGGAK